MSNVIRLKKGLDINLIGSADKILATTSTVESYAVIPDEFEGITPKLLVREGDDVKAGSPLFFDKNNPSILFTSPVSGKVAEVVRGEKRKILEVVISPNGNDYEKFDVQSATTREQVIELMLKSGLWPMVISRPYGIIAKPSDTPKAIFVSSFDSAPLAGDSDFMLKGREADLKAGFEVLKKLGNGNVNVGVSESSNWNFYKTLPGVKATTFAGKHPVGNVGVQIHHVNPISKGDIVWTMDIQNVAILGKFFSTGIVDMKKVIVLAGSRVKSPAYYTMIPGAKLSSVLNNQIDKGDNVRVINGNVLTGKKVNINGYLGFYNSGVTVIEEGNKFEFLGWITPRTDCFSMSHALFSWLTPKKKYDLNTNLNGGHRAYVMSGQYEKVLPMDIYPVYLIKAILAGDIDKMENLGIYEVIEEDLALCEFVCTSKTEVQDILRRGINLMIKELD